MSPSRSWRQTAGRTTAQVLLLALVAAVVAGFFLYRTRNASAARKLAVEARAQGHPMTLAELAATYPPIPDAENAAVPLLELWTREDPEFWDAFHSGERSLPERPPKQHDPALPFLGRDQRKVPSTTPLDPASLEAAETFLEQQADHMQAVREALRRPRARFPVNVTDGFFALLPHLPALRGEAQQFRIEALVALERGDLDRALGAIEDIAGISESLDGEPTLVSQLVRLALLTMVVDETERVLNRTTPSAAHLKELRALLERGALPGVLQRVFIQERAVALSVFDLPPATLQRLSDSSSGDGADGFDAVGYAFAMRWMAITGLQQADCRLMQETYTRCIELAANETPESLAGIEAVFDELERKLRRFPPKFFTMTFVPSLGRMSAKFFSYEARRRAALVATALEEYRLTHDGRLPENLEGLTPDWMTEVPTDPFDGKPLRVRRLEPGYVLYSIGPDRNDDGGKDRPTRGPARDYDDVFRVSR